MSVFSLQSSLERVCLIIMKARQPARVLQTSAVSSPHKDAVHRNRGRTSSSHSTRSNPEASYPRVKSQPQSPRVSSVDLHHGLRRPQSSDRSGYHSDGMKKGPRRSQGHREGLDGGSRSLSWGELDILEPPTSAPHSMPISLAASPAIHGESSPWPPCFPSPRVGAADLPRPSSSHELVGVEDVELGVSAENITVVVRTRPLHPSEQARAADEGSLIFDEQSHNVTLNLNSGMAATRLGPGPGCYSFTYDHVLSESCAQSRVFQVVGRQACHHFLDGYNVAVFAYGQTGAGKTFTMYGQGGGQLCEEPPASENAQGDDPEGFGVVPELAGMVPRCLFHIFAKLKGQRARGNSVTIKVSFIEIYNETIIDLLVPTPRLLMLREDALHDRIFVEGALEAKVDTLSEVVRLLHVGERNRTTGATAINAHSSRSHSVFTISLDAEHCTPNGQRVRRQSQFRLVDLAGSERQKYSKAEGRHLREAGSINRSLTVLGKVIMALADGKKHVPYRDSKLTFLLKNSLGGNSKTFIIANISPAAKCQEESLSTLKFASFARKPVVCVSRNTPNPGVNDDILTLQNEIVRLKAQLLRDHSLSPGAGANDDISQDHVPVLPSGQQAPSEYARNLEVSLRQALERENGLRAKLQRERSQFRTKLDEYEWLCRCATLGSRTGNLRGGNCAGVLDV